MGAEGPKLLPEPGSLQQQNQPVNPPIPGFPYRYNRLSIVLNEPNPLPKIQTKPPCRANAAARKLLQLQRNPIFRRFFTGKTYHRTPNPRAPVKALCQAYARPYPSSSPKPYAETLPAEALVNKPNQQAKTLVKLSTKPSLQSHPKPRCYR